MFLESVGYRRSTDDMPEIIECSRDSRVPPTRVLVCKSDDQLPDLHHDPGTTWPTAGREVVFQRDEFPIPAENGIK